MGFPLDGFVEHDCDGMRVEIHAVAGQADPIYLEHDSLFYIYHLLF